MMPSSYPSAATTAQTLAVVFACDEGYAMPLATTMRSLVEANTASWPLEVFVLSGGFSEASRIRVERSLPSGAARVHWLNVDLAQYAGFATLPHISTATYARLLIPKLFPAEVRRVLYLDADMLVLADLRDLWATDLRGKPLGAVTDLIDGIVKQGETGWEDVPRVAAYFNAGVLLMDLDAWRGERVSERALEYLMQHPDTRMADQDALNVACDGRWERLEARWNVACHRHGDIGALPASDRPGIAHFITFRKPWIARYRSANARFYDAFRQRTCFARTPRDRVKDTWSAFWAGVKNVLQRRGLISVEDTRTATTPVRRSGGA